MPISRRISRYDIHKELYMPTAHSERAWAAILPSLWCISLVRVLSEAGHELDACGKVVFENCTIGN